MVVFFFEIGRGGWEVGKGVLLAPSFLGDGGLERNLGRRLQSGTEWAIAEVGFSIIGPGQATIPWRGISRPAGGGSSLWETLGQSDRCGSRQRPRCIAA